MKIVAGLGNPGASYARNRHNIGFMAVDAIQHRHGFGPWRRKFQGDASEGTVGGQKCLLLKPSTYMNDSGRAVSEAARFYKAEVGDVIVLHDELDLAPGKVRAKVGGGHAGHNGLRSIMAHMGADFERIRLGIGHPGRKELVHRWVLGDFAKADEAWLEPLLDTLADHFDDIVNGRAEKAMSRIGQAVTPAGPASAAGGPSKSGMQRKASAKPVEKQAEKQNAKRPAIGPAIGASDTAPAGAAPALPGTTERSLEPDTLPSSSAAPEAPAPSSGRGDAPKPASGMERALKGLLDKFK